MFFQARAEMLHEGVQSLFLANGGAAVALLAFLPSIIDKCAKLAVEISNSLSLFAFGVACAAAIHFVRFFRAFVTDSSSKDRKADAWTFIWSILALISLLLFVIGIVLIGSASEKFLLSFSGSC